MSAPSHGREPATTRQSYIHKELKTLIYWVVFDRRFIFLTYPTPEEASSALLQLDQIMFGKNRLTVNKFGDIERYASMDIEEGGVPRGWVEETEVEGKVSQF